MEYFNSVISSLFISWNFLEKKKWFLVILIHIGPTENEGKNTFFSSLLLLDFRIVSWCPNILQRSRMRVFFFQREGFFLLIIMKVWLFNTFERSILCNYFAVVVGKIVSFFASRSLFRLALVSFWQVANCLWYLTCFLVQRCFRSV